MLIFKEKENSLSIRFERYICDDKNANTLPSFHCPYLKISTGSEMFNCEKLKKENWATITKGKRHNAGCTCEEKIVQTETCECVSERNIVTMDECFWINAPQWCAWQKKRKKKKRKKLGPGHFWFSFLFPRSKTIDSQKYIDFKC